jgi:hypothetical protein
MFESNFPVDKGSCDYAELWNAFKRIAAGYSAAEKAALFTGTARSSTDCHRSGLRWGQLPTTSAASCAATLAGLSNGGSAALVPRILARTRPRLAPVSTSFAISDHRAEISASFCHLRPSR